VDFVRQRLNNGRALNNIAEEVLDRCLAPEIGSHAGLGCDNMTVVLVQFKHPLS